MEQEKVDMFIALNAKNFPSSKMGIIRDQLLKLDSGKFNLVQSIDFKNPQTLLIISILIGGLGIDRFMLGQTGAGIGKLLTCGGLGIWSIIDWFNIQKMAKEANFKMLMEVAY